MTQDFSTVAGRWFVPNPDRGQSLSSADARLITGGEYVIDQSGKVTARIRTRDRAGITYDRELSGRTVFVDDAMLRFCLDERIVETFEFLDPKTLRRTDSNIGTEEPFIELMLQERFGSKARRSVLLSAGKKVSFLVAGVQKAGTTSLHTALSRHPGLCMSTVKETHFFDDESVDWANPDYEILHSNFRGSPEALFGDATPVTIYWRPALPRVKSYNRDMKFILLFRDPVKRAYSQWQQQYARGRDKLPFSSAIREGRQRVTPMASGMGEEKLQNYFYSYVERGFYGEQLDYLLTLFPRTNVFVETAEAFFRDQRGILERIVSFLGAEPFPEELTEFREHTAREVDYPSTLTSADVDHLRGVFGSDIARFRELVGRDLDTSGWLV